MRTTILIANPKGGSGKSTLATNLAGWFARQGNKTMLGDIDRQQSSRDWLRLRSSELPYISSWDIEPGKLARPPKGVSHVVLDSPAGLHGRKLERVLSIVQRIVIPIQPSLFDIAAAADFFDTVQRENARRKPQLYVAVVGMRVDSRTRAAKELERFLAQAAFPAITHLRDTQNYVQAAARGLTIFDLPPSQVAIDLQTWDPLLRWIGSSEIASSQNALIVADRSEPITTHEPQDY